MPTNVRIERLTREALGAPAQPLSLPEGILKTLAKITVVLVALLAMAGVADLTG